jgi:hypothetical protein
LESPDRAQPVARKRSAARSDEERETEIFIGNRKLNERFVSNIATSRCTAIHENGMVVLS